MNNSQQITTILPDTVDDDPVLQAVVAGLSREPELRRPLSELVAVMEGRTAGPEPSAGEWLDAMWHEELRWIRERPFREREKRLRAEAAKRLAKEERERKRKTRQRGRSSGV